MAKPTIIHTTLGDLIVALTEEATLLIRSELETYSVVALILTHLLGKRNTPSSAWEY